MIGGDEDGTGLTSCDRRVIRAMQAADTARKAAVVLRWVAAVIGLAGIVGYVLLTVQDDLTGFQDSEFGNIETPDRYQIGTFLVGAMWSVGIAAIVLGVSFLVEIYASRLDLDIVAADEEQRPQEAPEWGAPGLGG